MLVQHTISARARVIGLGSATDSPLIVASVVTSVTSWEE